MPIRRTGHRGWIAAVLLSLAPVSLAPGEAPAKALPPERPLLLELPSPPDVPPVSIETPRGRALYFPMVVEEARPYGLPPEVADAVMRVESGYDRDAVGGVGERGLMQILPSTAAMLGFRGTADELAEPATNIRLGIRYLAGAWRLAGGDLCRALMKYRAGHGEERMSALSVVYCRRARAHLAVLGSPLADGALPEASPRRVVASVEVLRGRAVGPAPAAAREGLAQRGRRRVATSSRRFWAAHTARVRAIEARLRWKRGGIMAGG